MGQRVLAQIFASRWAMTEPALRQLIAIATREQSDMVAAEIARHAVQASEGRPLDGTRTVTVRDGIATIPLVGPMFRYANLFTRMSGGTSSEMFARDFMAALSNHQVRGVLLAVNSPGGEVDGTHEAAELVFKSRGKKPIWAHVGGDGCSAAYYVASAADRILAGPDSVLGSIGVMATFTDWSEADRKAGIQTIEIVASQSPRKAIDPATDEGKAAIQAIIDDICEVMVASIARNRAVSRDTVITRYGGGGVFVGERALEQGLHDEIATFEDAHASLADRISGRRSLIMPGQPSPAAPPAAASEPAPNPAAPNPAAPAAPAPTPDPAAVATAAATAERERLAGLDALARPGAEAIITRAKADPTVTPAMAALEILKAEDGGRKKRLTGLAQDVATHPAPAALATGDPVESGSHRSLLATLTRVNQERAAAQRTS